jgi:predicted amidohydrolase
LNVKPVPQIKIGLAQIKSVKGDISHNLKHHLALLDCLAAGDADLVMFPELSLTNYDPDIAESVALAPDDAQLAPLQAFADRTAIAVGVGLPASTGHKPRISQVIFHPKAPRTVVRKSHLHEDELPYFSAEQTPTTILQMGKRVGIAICYEISVDAHFASAAEQGMEVLLASVAKTAGGMDQARQRLTAKAGQYGIPSLVANSVGTCEGKVAGGNSMAIRADGTVSCALNSQEEAILLYDLDEQTGKKLPIQSP